MAFLIVLAVIGKYVLPVLKKALDDRAALIGSQLAAADEAKADANAADEDRRSALEEARHEVATFLGVSPREVVFTSGGTEAINAAVWGATRKRPDGPVLFAAVEHSAVRDASTRLAPTEVIAVDASARGSKPMSSRRACATPRRRSRPWSTASGPTMRSGRCSPCTTWYGCAATPAYPCTSTPPPHAGTSHSTSGRSKPTW